MASRLNEEDASAKNQWADIDDDDDDWAPETITWGDGTKTTLPHPDEQPPPPQPQATTTTAPKVTQEENKQVSSPAISSAHIDVQPTKSTNLTLGRGRVLKAGPQEKPTLVAKPAPPPAAVKSPWAALPPIDRASPSAPEPVQLNRGPPQNYREVTQPPPKEIAADDFSRSPYRDGSSQLYNSQSGLYEPVPDRRGSMRHESQGRGPSLLQRPQAGDQPAEPSSAFQTHRNATDHSFGRRRASSNLSGGSGSYVQRMTKPVDGAGPPSDILNARRPSQAGSSLSPVSPNLQLSAPQGQQRNSWQQGSSPGTTHAEPQSGPNPGEQQPAARPVQDDVELQQRIMRESREQAKKRRLEEEARLEAEKQERIRKKLESLGPAPEKKSDKKETATKPEVFKPTQIQQRDQREQKDPSENVVKALNQLQQQNAEAAGSLPHDGNAVKPRRPSVHNAGPQSSQRRLSQSQDGKRPDIWNGSQPRTERFAPWAPNTQPPSHSVWGAPNNNRGLGNGTFTTELGRLPDAAGASPQASNIQGPAPIGPPGATRPETRLPPGPIGSRASRYTTTGAGSELASKWVNQVAENDKMISAEKLAEKVRRDAQLAEKGLTLEDTQPQIKDTWRQVQPTSEGTRRAVSAHLDGVAPPPPSSNPAGVIGSSLLNQPAQSTTSQGRPSRFFPTRDQRAETRESGNHGRPLSPSPPPPTMEDHPAYEGDVAHPHVSLPRSKPVVKLPPAHGSAPATAHPKQFGWAQPPPFTGHAQTHAAVVAATSASSQGPGQSQTEWQSRFNSLLQSHNKGSPPKSLGIDPASRNALDHPLHHSSATVSLPGRSATVTQVGDPKLPVTKPMAEICFEEQEMGSLPQIRLPSKAPDAAWQPAQEQYRPLPKKFHVQTTAFEPYYFGSEVTGAGHVLRIHVPGMKLPKTVTLPFSASRGGRGGHGRPGPRHRGSTQGGRGNKRETSSAARTERESASDTKPRGGRGSYRSRGSDNWSRQPSASQASVST